MKMQELFTDLGKNISLRKENLKDKSFLLSLYGSTREDELSATTMTPVQKRDFILQQFELKEKDYRSKFQDAEFLIINRKKKDIGRVVYRVEKKAHLIDIALIKKSRSLGFGREIINTLISHAKQNDKVFELNVAIDNLRALRLYQNLGLKIVSQNGYYYTMQI